MSLLVLLEVLILSHNRLTLLPVEVCEMTKLKNLYVDNNQLTTLPQVIYPIFSSFFNF